MLSFHKRMDGNRGCVLWCLIGKMISLFEIRVPKKKKLPFFPGRVNALTSFRLVHLNLRITFLVTLTEGLSMCEIPPPPNAVLLGCLNYTGVEKPN